MIKPICFCTLCACLYSPVTQILRNNQFMRHYFIALPLTIRCMRWNPLPETVCRMVAAFERIWTYLQRASGNGFQFMSQIV